MSFFYMKNKNILRLSFEWNSDFGSGIALTFLSMFSLQIYCYYFLWKEQRAATFKMNEARARAEANVAQSPEILITIAYFECTITKMISKAI